MKKALYYAFIFLCIQFFLSQAVTLVWAAVSGGGADAVLALLKGKNAPKQPISCTITAQVVCSVATFALFAWRKWAVLSRHYLRTRPFTVLLWSAVAALGVILPSAGLQELLPMLPDLTKGIFRDIMDNQYGYFTLCLFAPLVEEVVFRGAILRSLLSSKLHPWVAIAISALIFSVIHLNPAQMPHAFLVGLLLGWMYLRTGSILPGVAFHWVNNTAVYASYILMPQAADLTLSQLFGGDSVRIALSIVFSLFILVPALFQLNANMGKEKYS